MKLSRKRILLVSEILSGNILLTEKGKPLFILVYIKQE